VNDNVFTSLSFLSKGEGKVEPRPFRSLSILILVALLPILISPIHKASPETLFAQFLPKVE